MSLEPSIAAHHAYLEARLSPTRLQHSLQVMQVMAELAPIYGLDSHAAQVAGLAHDAGKELPETQMIALAGVLGIPLEHPAARDPLYLHGPCSAYVAETQMGIRDPLVLEAIAHHSYMLDGKVQSPSFIWCLRFADLLEPGRDWVAMKQRITPLVYAGQMAQAAFALVEWLVPFLESVGVTPHPRQVALRDLLAAYLAAPERREMPV